MVAGWLKTPNLIPSGNVKPWEIWCFYWENVEKSSINVRFVLQIVLLSPQGCLWIHTRFLIKIDWWIIRGVGPTAALDSDFDGYGFRSTKKLGVDSLDLTSVLSKIPRARPACGCNSLRRLRKNHQGWNVHSCSSSQLIDKWLPATEIDM